MTSVISKSAIVSKANKININIVMSAAAVGLFILCLPLATGSIYGYGLIFFALMALLLLHLALKAQSIESTSGIISSLKIIFMGSETLPIIGLMIVIAALLSLNIIYYDNFNNTDMLPQEFLNFKSLATGLIFVALILIKTITDNEILDNTVGSNKSTSDSMVYILYLVVLVLAINIGLMQVILQYYLTDG